MVSALGGYHGCTGLAMSAGSPEWRDPFGPTPESFRQVPYDDLAALEGALRAGEQPAAVRSLIGVSCRSGGRLRPRHSSAVHPVLDGTLDRLSRTHLGGRF